MEAAPTVTPMSREMSGSSPAAMNSLVTIAKMPVVISQTEGGTSSRRVVCTTGPNQGGGPIVPTVLAHGRARCRHRG